MKAVKIKTGKLLVKYKNKNRIKRIYINTLVPNFKFKDKNNQEIIAKNKCISL
ncbi:MAG: hypothetical protein ACWA42_08680 [Lutibacter sp.]